MLFRNCYSVDPNTTTARFISAKDYEHAKQTNSRPRFQLCISRRDVARMEELIKEETYCNPSITKLFFMLGPINRVLNNTYRSSGTDNCVSKLVAFCEDVLLPLNNNPRSRAKLDYTVEGSTLYPQLVIKWNIEPDLRTKLTKFARNFERHAVSRDEIIRRFKQKYPGARVEKHMIKFAHIVEITPKSQTLSSNLTLSEIKISLFDLLSNDQEHNDNEQDQLYKALKLDDDVPSRRDRINTECLRKFASLVKAYMGKYETLQTALDRIENIDQETIDNARAPLTNQSTSEEIALKAYINKCINLDPEVQNIRSDEEFKQQIEEQVEALLGKVDELIKHYDDDGITVREGDLKIIDEILKEKKNTTSSRHAVDYSNLIGNQKANKCTIS